jgi:hypothetical protein
MVCAKLANFFGHLLEVTRDFFLWPGASMNVKKLFDVWSNDLSTGVE